MQEKGRDCSNRRPMDRGPDDIPCGSVGQYIEAGELTGKESVDRKSTSSTKCKHFVLAKRDGARTTGKLSEDKLWPNSVEFAARHLKCLALIRFGPNYTTEKASQVLEKSTQVCRIAVCMVCTLCSLHGLHALQSVWSAQSVVCMVCAVCSLHGLHGL